MKKITLLLLLNFLFLIFNSSAQAPNWLWAHNATGAYDDICYSIATDGSGNIYETGYFNSPSITFGSTTLPGSGNYDIFIVKYSPAGNVLWAKSAGGSNNDFAFSIAIDNSGNAYITGYYLSSAMFFGSDSVVNTLAGTADMFIAKYDAAGNVLWVAGAGGASGDDASNAIAVDGSGNCYVTGSFFGSSIHFGTDSLVNASVLCFGGPEADVFVAKYSSSGNFLWAKGAGGNRTDEGLGIAVDGSGSCYITGYFRSLSVTFGSTTLTNAGGSCNCGCQDVFIAKYDAAGNPLWATGAGGSGIDYGYGIAVDGSGNYYVTGWFVSSSITFGSTTLTNAGGGYDDFYIVKYSPAGNALWAKSAGGNDVDGGQGIAVDASGNSYVTGGFRSSSITFGSTTLTNTGTYNNLFITKYDASGNVLWAKSAGGNNDDYGVGAALDASGNCYVTGSFNSPSITFGSAALTNAGGYDVFIAKLEPSIGINEINGKKNDISIFPNPATSELRIENSELKIKEVEIYNVLGEKRLTLNPSANGEGLRVDVSSLASGIYFVKVRGEKEEKAAKFVKQ